MDLFERVLQVPQFSHVIIVTALEHWRYHHLQATHTETSIVLNASANIFESLVK